MLGSLFNIIFDLILDDTFSFQVRDEIEIPDMITLNFNLQSVQYDVNDLAFQKY